MWERLGAMEVRLRQLENLETPVASRALAEFRELEDIVRRMDVEGTHATNLRFRGLEEDVHEIRDDAKGLRMTVRSALITAAASIAVQIIVFLALRAGS